MSQHPVRRWFRSEAASVLRSVSLLAATGLLLGTPLRGQVATDTGRADSPAERVAAREEDPFDFYQRGPYRDDVPAPREYLGYRLGSLHTSHDRMLGYFRALERAAPERIQLETYGRSYEGRRLVLAFIGSPGVLGRRSAIRDSIRALTRPGETSRERARAIAAGTPVIVWLDYGNDGNETANLEAALQVAYQLVAGEGEETQRFRRRALVILNPDHNPESHDRHAAWYDAFAVGAEDPLALEHHAPWGMSTNNNHYQIDLNRDAWGLTQRENQALAVQVLRWRPQVFVDHHGQTEQYFFPPPVLPVNKELPSSHIKWYERFGEGNARAFDRRGWQYYVRDVFDLYYPGYWDSWPALHGAIGMTYETDAGGSRGLRWRRQDGTVVTFRDGIAHHFVASLSTVRTAVEHREALLRDYASFFRDAVEKGREGRPARAYVLEAGEDPRRAASLVSTLLRHGVEVERAQSGFRREGRRHQTGRTVTRRYPAGSFVVDMAQPEGRVAATFLRADAGVDSTFLRRQFARWSRNARRGEDAPKEGYEFYDVTSWSLPLAYGVDAYALEEMPGVATSAVRVEPARLVGDGGWEEEVPAGVPAGHGGVTSVIPGPRGRGAGAASARRRSSGEEAGRARSGYLFRPHTGGALRLLASLLEEGFEVAVSTRPLMVADRAFPRGTYVLRVSRNPESVHRRIRELAREAGVPVVASHTAFPAAGQTGTGSNDVVGLRAPRLAVVADEGVRVTSYGHTWFTLERRLGYPFTPLRFEQLLEADLDRFDVVVLPDGSSPAYRKALGEDGVSALRAWVERGGVLVGWGGGAFFAARHGLAEASVLGNGGGGRPDSLPTEERIAAIDTLPGTEEPVPPFVSPTARPGALQPVPGAVLRAELDRTHWLTLGYEEETLPVLVTGDEVLGLSPSGSNPLVFPDDGPLTLSGFVWPGNTERHLRGTAHAVAESRGRGQVILFHTDPNFRLVWRSTTRLFGNAVLLAPTLGTGGSSGH